MDKIYLIFSYGFYIPSPTDSLSVVLSIAVPVDFQLDVKLNVEYNDQLTA